MQKTYRFGGGSFHSRGLGCERFFLCYDKLREIFGVVPSVVLITVSDEYITGFSEFRVNNLNWVKFNVNTLSFEDNIDAALVHDIRKLFGVRVGKNFRGYCRIENIK